MCVVCHIKNIHDRGDVICGINSILIGKHINTQNLVTYLHCDIKLNNIQVSIWHK